MSNYDKNLKREETEVAKAIEHDVATGVPPSGDVETQTRAQALLDKDPTFGAKIEGAIAKGDREWERAHPGTPSPEEQSSGLSADMETVLAGGESGLDDDE